MDDHPETLDLPLQGGKSIPAIFSASLIPRYNCTRGQLEANKTDCPRLLSAPSYWGSACNSFVVER